MDADRFDELTVSLGADRRALVRGLLAGAVAALVGRGAADAGGCGAPRDKCTKRADCCATGCTKKRGKKTGRCKPCPGGRIFCFGVCCPRGAALCSADSERCVCGTGAEPCGNFCCPTGTCQDGRCQCPGGGVFCLSERLDSQCCAAGDTCDPERGCTAATCDADNAFVCGGPNPVTGCGGPPESPCFCRRKADGGAACGAFDFTGCPGAATPCDGDGDCGAGEFCADLSGPTELCGCGPAPFGLCATLCPPG